MNLSSCLCGQADGIAKTSDIAPGREMTAEIVLFYLYTHLSDLETLEGCLKEYTTKKGITGRLLLSEEGINGTVGSTCIGISDFKDEFVRLVPAACEMPWKTSMLYRDEMGPSSPFIDMKIKVVKELVGWGFGVKMHESENVSHLTPSEFHEFLKQKKGDSDMILMDMRNQQESALGHFEGAMLPLSKNMPDLGTFLESQSDNVCDKTVLMYCTGGIRCEKASLYLDQISGGKAKHIYQLNGGIHEYLEEFSESPDCQFLGKNFVFGRRGYAGEGRKGEGNKIVGKCQECTVCDPYLTGCAVCVGCRFQLLLCKECLPKNGGEHFCFSHKDLSDCYSLHRIPTLTINELTTRIRLLKQKEIELREQGRVAKRKGRHKRRTIRHCYTAMESALATTAKSGPPPQSSE
jgi:predicted sulfurtransferase